MIPARFSQIELNTAIASRVKSAGGIRTRDRKFPAFGVDHSNHYSIETRHSKQRNANVNSGLNRDKCKSTRGIRTRDIKSTNLRGERSSQLDHRHITHSMLV